VLNAVSVFLMIGSATLALIAVVVQRERPPWRRRPGRTDSSMTS
jgi:hypothetical protein